MYKIQGVLKVISPTVQVSEKFSKREFVITESSGMYPQDILFQLIQEKCQLLDEHNQGDNIEVSFNLRGREWTSPQGEVKYFNTLEAWRLESLNKNRENVIPSSGPSEMDLSSSGKNNESSAFSTEAQDDDVLPF